MIPDSFLQELRDKNDIEEIISRYVTVKRAGRNLVALCPFHSEKTPSFTIFPDTQSFYCFGCGSGGDVITFVRQIENLDYIDAVKFLAQNSGLTVPEDSYDNRYDEYTGTERENILAMNKIAAKFYHESLNEQPEASPVKQYLKKRQLSGKTVLHFGLGFSPSWDGLIKLLRKNGYSDSQILSSGLGTKSQKGNIYDRFKDRLIFPIIDVRGNVLGFGGRVLDDSKPKYLNSPDTAVFKKSLNLFALNFAKAHCKDRLVLCEGYMDVIAMHKSGFQNAVATLGTAITPEQARLISRYTKSVLISYDSDEAGQKAAQKAIKLLGEVSVEVKVLKISGGKDPDEYIREYGADRFKSIMDEGSSYIDYKIGNIKNKYDTDTTDGLVAFLKDAAAVIADIKSPLEREVFLNKTAQEYGVSKQNFEKEVSALLKRRDNKQESMLVKDNIREVEKKERKRARIQKEFKAQEMLCAMLSEHPDYYFKIESIVSADDFADELCKKIYIYLTDRIIKNEPMNYTVMSQHFTPDEMGAFVGMTANMKLYCTGRVEEAVEYASLISKINKNKIDSTCELSDDQFRDLFRNRKGKE